MKKVKVLFLPQEGTSKEWSDEVVAAIGPKHDLRIYDKNKALAEQFEGIEVVVDMGGSVGTKEMYDVAKDVRLWQVLGTGLDHVDVASMKAKGFMVSNCPGDFSCVGLGECAIMFIIMLSRRVQEAMQNFKTSAGMYMPFSNELEGKVLGMIGCGSSAQELARRAKGFGMKIRAIDIQKFDQELLDELGIEFLGGPDDTDKVIEESDYLSLHLHLNDKTKHIIDKRRIGLMKSTACIINVARGGLVDEDAMYAALLNGELGGAGLDVFAQEPTDPTLAVYQLPNVVTTPHIAGVTNGTARKRAGAAAVNADRIAQGQEPLYRVDK